MTDEMTYFSIDIETDGPIPFDYSMISFASVAFVPSGRVLGAYEVNLDPILGAKQHPDTMKFWGRNPDAWDYCNSNTRDPKEAMPEFAAWVEKHTLGSKRTAVCYPSGFDFTFLFSYLIRYAGKSPFMFSCMDMRSYVSAVRKVEYQKAGKSYWPKRWRVSSIPHSHRAIDDAAEQGLSFLKIRTEHMEGSTDNLKAIEAEYLKTVKPFLP